MKKRIDSLFYIILISITLLLILTACANRDGDHLHSFSDWTTVKAPTCTDEGTQTRKCEICGLEESSPITATGHTEVIDAAIPATCTEGGKSAGAHCGVCQAVLIPQTATSAAGHKYGDGTVEIEATCSSSGSKKFTCSVCEHTYSEKYSLPTYTATEIYNQSVKYVGEIITRDKGGNELALGTGFVISEDGRVVTNYHVIDGAYSAKITIDGKTYDIGKVLAYDADIDLAVLTVNAKDMPYARVCKNAVSAGETVYAIGSSRGLTNTYSQGIVTYAARELDGITYVQHDASITHGNSGGPLINAYGEVIGINTWGVDDSQNLNFAVFAGELDELKFGTPISMSEFYDRSRSTFNKLRDYIIENGDYNSDHNVYSIGLASATSSDGTTTYENMAFYYVEEDFITIDMLIDDGDYWAYFEIDDSLSGEYGWCYFDLYDNEMLGMLNASTFTSSTLLSYDEHNISNTATRDSVRELASSMISDICDWMEVSFGDIGIMPKDLGFDMYV